MRVTIRALFSHVLVPVLLAPDPLFAQSVSRGRIKILDSVRLETSNEHPLVRLAGLARLTDGRLVIADLSEGNIRVHSRTGRLEQVFGRRGDGPGEFRGPAWPRVDRLGRIHVVDVILRRITILTTDRGTQQLRLQRTVSINQSVSSISSFDLLADGGYLISGTSTTTPNNLLQLDSTGIVTSSSLPIMNYRRSRGSTTDDGMWRSLTTMSAGTDGLQTFAVLSTFDTLWTLNRNGVAKAEHIPYAQYERPALPATPPNSRDALKSWAKSQMVLSLVSGYRRVFVPIFRGTYYEGGSSDVMVKERTGWLLLSSAPAILTAVGDTVFSLRSIDDPIVLLRWTPERQ